MKNRTEKIALYVLMFFGAISLAIANNFIINTICTFITLIYILHKFVFDESGRIVVFQNIAKLEHAKIENNLMTLRGSWRMFRKYGLYIIVVFLFILSLFNNDGNAELMFRVMCLIMPLWFAGSIGGRAIDGVYKISKAALKHLIKKPLPDISYPKVYIPKIIRRVIKKPLPERVHIPAFIYDNVSIVIAAAIQIGVYCWLAAAMAKTYLYTDFFTALTIGYEGSLGTNIHDLLSAYFTILIMTYIIIAYADLFYKYNFKAVLIARR